MNLRKRLACRLQQLREDKNFTQEQLAAAAGVDRSYIGRVELGHSNISIDTIEKLTVALGVGVADFFKGDIFMVAETNHDFRSLIKVTKELQYHLEELVDNSTMAEMPIDTIKLKDGREAQITVRLETDEDSFLEPGVSYEISL